MEKENGFRDGMKKKDLEYKRSGKEWKKGTEETQLSTILESIADGVFTIDSDWRVASFNRAAARITGVPREKALGQKCFDVFHANICQTACALKRTLETGREIIDLPVDILNDRGETLPISISTAVLRDRKGRIIGGARNLSGSFESRNLAPGTFRAICRRRHG